MFKNIGIFNADLSNWDTGKVTDMYASTSTSVSHFLFMDDVTDFLFFFDFISCHPPFVAVDFYIWMPGSV